MERKLASVPKKFEFPEKFKIHSELKVSKKKKRKFSRKGRRELREEKLGLDRLERVNGSVASYRLFRPALTLRAVTADQKRFYKLIKSSFIMPGQCCRCSFDVNIRLWLKLYLHTTLTAYHYILLSILGNIFFFF